jgi:hypothetical protein
MVRINAVAVALAVTLVTLGPATGPSAGSGHAHFVVTDRVINSDVGAFTATVEGVGNGGRLVWQGSGFEPVVFRTRLTATEDAPDRIVAAPHELSHWDTLASGALNGARVDVYRIAEGQLSHVRRDRIAEGGFHASGWTDALPDGQLIPPGATRHVFAFDPWNRPGAPYHFALVAVGEEGRASAPSNAVAAVAPAPFPPVRAETEQSFVAAPVGEGHDVAPSSPRDLSAQTLPEGAVALAWEAPADGAPLAGYRLLVSDLPPEEHRGHYALLEGDGEPLRAGDLVIVHKRFDAPSRSRYHTNRVWGAHGETALLAQPLVPFFPDEEPGRTWRLRQHAPDTPVAEPGETYLELTLARGEQARLGTFNNAGTGQHWYEVLEPGRAYRIEVWARVEEGRPSIRVSLSGFYGNEGTRAEIRPQVLVAGPQWTLLSARIVPRVLDEGDDPGGIWLEIDGPGTLALDNLRMFREDTPFLDLEPHDYDRLASSGMSALRTHALIKTGRRTYDLEQLTNPGGVTSGTSMQNTLPQSLGIIERAGMVPWLQIEPHLAPEEWRGLVEYLAAPHDPADPAAAPWAAKRAAQGRADPWSEAFDSILFEVGNETWNGLFAPWTFPPMTDAVTGRHYGPGEVYGLFQEHVLREMRASPHWDALEERLSVVVGGWPGAGYGRDAAALSPASNQLAIAAYNGGWDVGAGPPRQTPESFFNLLNDVSQYAVPLAIRHAGEAAEIGRDRGRPLGVATYEAGPGYALDGLNGDRVSEEEAAEQERVMKSLAAGTATLDAFLARAAWGFSLQNFFTFGEGRYWRSHAPWHAGGQAYPSWLLLALFNRVGTGEMLAVESRSLPRADLPAAAHRPAVAAAPLAAAYATREGDRMTLVLVSRRVPGYPDGEDDGATAVTVDLPVASARRITRYHMPGAHDAHNVDREDVRLVAEDLDPARLDAGRLEIPELPAGHAEIWVLEGVEPHPAR